MDDERYRHLDGVRGVAAVVVAVFHFLRAFQPTFLNPADSLQYSALSILWNGHFAVLLFFVLSGFIFFLKFRGATIKLALIGCGKRYIRLTGPILIASVATLAVHRYFGFSNAAAGVLSQSDWLVRWYGFVPDPYLAVIEPIGGMYFSFDSIVTYNSNLWTIRYELFCVWLVIALAVVCGHINRTAQIALISAVALASMASYTFAFLVGALLGLMLRDPGKTSLQWKTAIPILFVSASLSSYFSIAPVPSGVTRLIVWPICAVGILYVCGSWSPLKRALSGQFFQWLGQMSFGIYIVHFVIASSVASWMYVATQSIASTFIVYLLTTAVMAVCFHFFAEKPWIHLADAIVGWLTTRPLASASVPQSPSEKKEVELS